MGILIDFNNLLAYIESIRIVNDRAKTYYNITELVNGSIIPLEKLTDECKIVITHVDRLGKTKISSFDFPGDILTEGGERGLQLSY